MIQDHWKQKILLLMYFQKVSSSLTLHHSAHVIHFTLPHPPVITRRRVSVVQ